MICTQNGVLVKCNFYFQCYGRKKIILIKFSGAKFVLRACKSVSETEPRKHLSVDNLFIFYVVYVIQYKTNLLFLFSHYRSFNIFML